MAKEAEQREPAQAFGGHGACQDAEAICPLLLPFTPVHIHREMVRLLPAEVSHPPPTVSLVIRSKFLEWGYFGQWFPCPARHSLSRFGSLDFLSHRVQEGGSGWCLHKDLMVFMEFSRKRQVPEGEVEQRNIPGEAGLHGGAPRRGARRRWQLALMWHFYFVSWDLCFDGDSNNLVSYFFPN